MPNSGIERSSIRINYYEKLLNTCSDQLHSIHLPSLPLLQYIQFRVITKLPKKNKILYSELNSITGPKCILIVKKQLKTLNALIT